MSRVWISSDLHIGHAGIGKFRKNVNSESHNRSWISKWWYANVAEDDQVILLGDSAFTEESIDFISKLTGIKENYGGNHDELPVTSYLRAFTKIHGCGKRFKLGWFSHFPLHPSELRGKFCIHGHVHYGSIPDWRYINVSCDNLFENTGQPMIELNDLRKLIDKRKKYKKVVY